MFSDGQLYFRYLQTGLPLESTWSVDGRCKQGSWTRRRIAYVVCLIIKRDLRYKIKEILTIFLLSCHFCLVRIVFATLPFAGRKLAFYISKPDGEFPING